MKKQNEPQNVAPDPWQQALDHVDALQQDLDALTPLAYKSLSRSGLRLVQAELRHLRLVLEQTHEQEAGKG